jgi:hypothetical protein
VKRIINIFSTANLFVYVLSTFLFSQTFTKIDPGFSIPYDLTNPKGNSYPVPKYIPYQSPGITTEVRMPDGSKTFIFPNFRVNPTTNTQSETSIDIHPLNHNILFGSANTSDSTGYVHYPCGLYYTLDGQTWHGNDNPPVHFNIGDPAAVIGANGYFYLGFIDGGSNSGGQGLLRSSDNGSSWQYFQVAPAPAGSSNFLDKNHLMIDKKINSPFLNRLYAGYTPYTQGATNNDQVCFRYSPDDGQTWSAEKNLSSAVNAGNNNTGINIQTGPNGEVYATWAIYDEYANPEDAIGFAKSTDGGATWTPGTRIYSHSNFGIMTQSLAPKNIRANSFPSMAVDRSSGLMNGSIYITFTARGVLPAGSDPDILMIKSVDGGNTWSQPVRVNDDPVNNGKDQYFNWCTVDQTTGSLYIVFYDSRNVSNDSAQVYMAVSMDGGASFTNLQVSDPGFKFKPAHLPGNFASGYQGDYIGIAGADGVAYPFWMDNRTGNYQAWISKVSFGPGISHSHLANTENLNGPYKVGFKISSPLPVDLNKSWVYWSRNNSVWDSLPLVAAASDSFYAHIPGTSSAANYSYYIYVSDNIGGIGKNPATAPFSYYSFTAATDNIPPAITHTVLPDQYRENWPAVVNAKITDNIGVDTAWVIYKINFTGSLNTFKLVHISDSLYSAAFNIDTSRIKTGDTMFYRICSNDTSKAHNIGYFPSPSAFNSFKFISDTIPPVIVHTPLNNQASGKWPATVEAVITDDHGINSVKCYYKINNEGINSFSLQNIGGSTYSGVFNTDPASLQGGDSVFYQIFAVDNSTNHNTASAPVSGYNSFKIINSKYAVLVVNDDVTLKERISSEKTQGKADMLTPLGASSSLIASTLNDSGYFAESVNFNDLNVSNLHNYDLVILSSGTKSTQMFADLSKRTAIVNYVLGGGKTFVEGGEVGWKYRQAAEYDANFRRTVLNDSTWISDCVDGNLVFIDPSDSLFNVPNQITGPIIVTNASSSPYASRDVVTLIPNKPGVRKLAGWVSTAGNYPDTAGIIIHYNFKNDTLDVRNVFFTFSIAQFADPNIARKLIVNTAYMLFDNHITFIENTFNSTAPAAFSLEQNFPNPFNPSTSIKFSVPKEGKVSLVVYNLLGQKVVTLFDGIKRAGYYELKFDASHRASGIYFYRLESGNFVSVKKMILMK